MPRNAQPDNIWRIKSDPTAYQSHPIQGGMHQQYREDGRNPRMEPWVTRNSHHLTGQRDPEYVNTGPSSQEWYDSSIYAENTRPNDGRKLPDIPTHHAPIPNGAKTGPFNATNLHAPNHMPGPDRCPPMTIDVNDLSSRESSMHLPRKNGQVPQPGPSIPAYSDNMDMVMNQPHEMTMNRTANQGKTII